ncbi:hypothetical protein BJF86_13830 [Serinicoccus sp. CNJ-927]|uniref:hypothetical protein n=1 Tax=Serinicoccus sp. CNJ-927 TaxID=1904970 RepID=UPI0009605F71|nr:hypothetical protein [Serinicoccus sp. CNJ-927]OLT43696.1 hypothetical protein BJF86_13830 [Serinicoccus sp. CNJ-927]
MSRLIATLTGRRSWIVALVGLLLGVALIGGVGQAERDASALDTLPAGFDSTQGQALLDELPDEGSKAAIVLFTAEEGIEESLPDLATLLEDVAPEGTQAPPGARGSPRARPAVRHPRARRVRPATSPAGRRVPRAARRQAWPVSSPSSPRRTARRRSACSTSTHPPPPRRPRSSPRSGRTSPTACPRG